MWAGFYYLSCAGLLVFNRESRLSLVCIESFRRWRFLKCKVSMITCELCGNTITTTTRKDLPWLGSGNNTWARRKAGWTAKNNFRLHWCKILMTSATIIGSDHWYLPCISKSTSRLARKTRPSWFPVENQHNWDNKNAESPKSTNFSMLIEKKTDPNPKRRSGEVTND